MNRGLTLIETVLYIALLSIFATLALPLLADLGGWQTKQRILADSVKDYFFLEAKIRRLAGEATAIITPPAGESSQTLSLETENRGRVTLRLNTAGAPVLNYDDENEAIALAATGTIVSDFRFYQPAGGPERIIFSASVNGLNFGSTTYFFRNE